MKTNISKLFNMTVLSFLFFTAAPVFAGSHEIKGQFSVGASTMSAASTDEVSRTNTPVQLQFESSYNINKILSIQFQPWVQVDPLNKSSDEKSQYEVQELSLQHKKNSRRFKAGFTTVNWEGTDLINPMDIMNAKNWRDPLNPIARGSGSIVYADEKKSFAWDMIYTPSRAKDEFPGDQSPWWPRSLTLPTENENIRLTIPSELKYRMQREEELNSALTNNAGLRLQYHGPDWDFSIAGTESAASPAILVPTLDVLPLQVSPISVYQLQSPVRMTPVYYKQRSVAGAFVKTWEEVILRISAQHIQPLGTDTRIPNWSEMGVLELEKTLSWNDQSITLIFEATQSKRPETTTVASLSTLLQQSYILGFRWPVFESLVWNAAIFQEQKYKSTYFHTDMTKSWGDHLSFALALDMFSGSDQSLIGVYDSNDRALLKMNYAF